MNLEMLNLLDKFYSLVWPMLAHLRFFDVLVNFFCTCGQSAYSAFQFRLVLTVFLSLHMDIPSIDPVTAEGLKEIVNQLFIGLVMALIMQLATCQYRRGRPSCVRLHGFVHGQYDGPQYGQCARDFPVLHHPRDFGFFVYWRAFDCVWFIAGIVHLVSHWQGLV
jgi:flagellar biosynthetic protein FliR